MNALRTGFLVLIIGSVPGLSVAQDAGQSAVDFSGCYVGFGDEGIIGHNAARMPPGNPRWCREAKQTRNAARMPPGIPRPRREAKRCRLTISGTLCSS